MTDAAVVGSEEGSGGRSDDSGFAIGAGEGINRAEGIPNRENNDFSAIAGGPCEKFSTDEARNGLEFGRNILQEVMNVKGEIFRAQTS